MEAGLGTIKVGEGDGDKFDTGPVQSLPQLEKPLGVGPEPLAYREGVMVQPEAVASLGLGLAVEPVDDRYSDLLEAIARAIKVIYTTTEQLMRLMSDVETDILEMLLPHEQVVFKTKQSRFRPGGSTFTPNAIYVTNRRLIWRNPKLLGLKKDYNTAEYKDISNIRLKKGMFSTEIFLNSRWLSGPIKLPAIDKRDAAVVNKYIQQGMRSELPGQIITEKVNTPQIIKRPEEQDPIAQLEKLGKLRDAGVLTEEEFDTQKKDILSKM